MGTMIQMTLKLNYSELSLLNTFEERFEYLSLGGVVGSSTFGYDRYLNQRFYRSPEWRRVRHQVILRDNACDLGDPDREIFDKILIHHMNPIAVEDLEDYNPDVLNPDYLITTTLETHNAIHFGDASLLKTLPPERYPGDTVPWRV